MNDDNSISNDNTKDAVVVISDNLHTNIFNKVARAELDNRIERMKIRSKILHDLGCDQLDLHVWFHQNCPVQNCNYNQDNWMMRGSCCNPECSQDNKIKLKAYNIIHSLLDQST